MPKTITLRLDDETYGEFARQAKAENRSISNFIETAARAHIREFAFASDAEMAEILANDALVARLRKGNDDVRKNRGRMIG